MKRRSQQAGVRKKGKKKTTEGVKFTALNVKTNEHLGGREHHTRLKSVLIAARRAFDRGDADHIEVRDTRGGCHLKLIRGMPA